MNVKRVGVALGSGSARGMAHIGVLEVLQQEGIQIDMIAGTSMGALVGAIYAQGKDVRMIKNEAIGIDRRQIVRLLDLTIPRTGFVEGRRLKRLLREVIGGEIKFSDLKLPLAVVATDIMTGEEVVIKDGSVLEGVRASISLPIIFTVSKWRGRYLLDGGLVNPVPVNVLRKMGADIVIAVNVIPDPVETARYLDSHQISGEHRPNIVHVTMQSFYIGTYALVKNCLQDADVVIQPHLSHVYAYEFTSAAECIMQGEIAARAAIPAIKKLLQKPARKPRKQLPEEKPVVV